MISPIEIVELYDTGIPKLLRSNGLEFAWHSWLLCHVRCHKDNAEHVVICTGFRFPGFYNQLGIAPAVEVARWNPSYEKEHEDGLKLSSLYSWKPVEVIRSTIKV